MSLAHGIDNVGDLYPHDKPVRKSPEDVFPEPGIHPDVLAKASSLLKSDHSAARAWLKSCGFT